MYIHLFDAESLTSEERKIVVLAVYKAVLEVYCTTEDKALDKNRDACVIPNGPSSVMSGHSGSALCGHQSYIVRGQLEDLSTHDYYVRILVGASFASALALIDSLVGDVSKVDLDDYGHEVARMLVRIPDSLDPVFNTTDIKLGERNISVSLIYGEPPKQD